MLYGSFKEASSSEVDLPKDNYKIMKLLFDIDFEGSSELDSLDDIILLMEVVDWYEIKQDTVHCICNEAILTELDLSNYIHIRMSIMPWLLYLKIKQINFSIINIIFCSSKSSTSSGRYLILSKLLQ